jgi:hypothetical protein
MTADDGLAEAIDRFTQWQVDSRQIVIRLIPDQLGPPDEVWTADLQPPIAASPCR